MNIPYMSKYILQKKFEKNLNFEVMSDIFQLIFMKNNGIHKKNNYFS